MLRYARYKSAPRTLPRINTYCFYCNIYTYNVLHMVYSARKYAVNANSRRRRSYIIFFEHVWLNCVAYIFSKRICAKIGERNCVGEEQPFRLPLEFGMLSGGKKTTPSDTSTSNGAYIYLIVSISVMQCCYGFP